MPLAHGVGTRGDLPVPVEYAALAAGLVLVLTFVLLGVLWRTPRLRGAAAGRPLPEPPRLLGPILRAVTTVLAVAVVVVGFTGPPETPDNLAPWTLYVVFWVGLVPASLLLGPVWRVLNPLRALHLLLARILRIDPAGRGVPARVGLWPAAVVLGAFGWLELAAPEPADPRLVAACLTGYAVVQVAAALVLGRDWFAHGDGFEVWSTLLGALAPLGRRGDGRLVLRNPLDGLEAVRPRPGLTAVVLVLLGTTAFDGLSRSELWPLRGTLWATVGLVGATALVTALWLLGTRRADPVRGEDRAPLPRAFAHTLVPIAAGYAIAHYFSLLVFDGQQVVVLLGWREAVDYTVVGVGAIAAVQLGAIVLGHVAAAVAAHERAVRLFPSAVALRIQYPILASMVILTCVAVALVLAP
ncbi:hypothetical protein [Pseudonocardia sp. WMMC193]|uniref:hypothetical protein n=1 Tax=Pseudonocardia sp. WMMC193 TaxID=2911965 RepID=UPI001F3DDE5A|nr:hypothetical protein [Pseudonocardia sp. WMMC193]MCF7549459.1 hypothetical protein [Pseudonocardia sp. WMMC193]